MATIRHEARRLALSVLELTGQLEQNRQELAGYVQQLAPGLQDIRGVGPVTGAQVIAA